MNLREFEKWALAQRSVANPAPDGGFKGQCVSLVQQYLDKVCGIGFKARGNAKNWANNIIEGWDKFDVSNTVKAGDILVYTSGTYGHIVIVDADLQCLEQNRNFNGIVTVSTIRIGYSCIIRNRQVIDVGAVETNNINTYNIGTTYTTQVILKVRAGAGTNYAQKTYSQLTANAKANAYSNGANIGCLKVGTRVTCQEVRNVGNDTWIRIPSGWIAGVYQGKLYVK